MPGPSLDHITQGFSNLQNWQGLQKELAGYKAGAGPSYLWGPNGWQAGQPNLLQIPELGQGDAWGNWGAGLGFLPGDLPLSLGSVGTENGRTTISLGGETRFAPEGFGGMDPGGNYFMSNLGYHSLEPYTPPATILDQLPTMVAATGAGVLGGPGLGAAFGAGMGAANTATQPTDQSIWDIVKGAGLGAAEGVAGGYGGKALGLQGAPTTSAAQIASEFGTETPGLGGYTAADFANPAAVSPYAPTAGSTGLGGMTTYVPESLGGAATIPAYPGIDAAPYVGAGMAAPTVPMAGASAGLAPGGSSWIPTSKVAGSQAGAGAAPGAGGPLGKVAAMLGLGDMGGGGMSMGGWGLPALLGAKTGLGALMNFEQQGVWEDDRKKRRKYLDDISAMEANPESIYQNDPSLRAMRDQVAKDALRGYAAKYGGTAGSEAQVARALATFDRQALDDRIRRMQTDVGLTTPGTQAYAQAGGGGLGAFAGPAQGALSDYAFLQFLSSLGGRA